MIEIMRWYLCMWPTIVVESGGGVRGQVLPKEGEIREISLARLGWVADGPLMAVEGGGRQERVQKWQWR